MERRDLPYEPWQALQKLVPSLRGETAFRHHPPRAVLQAYLRESLPQRPPQWSQERAEGLAEGRLTNWTMWEVAAHLSSCPRCQAKLEALQHREAWDPFGWLARLRATMTKPKFARVGWALAGIQAALIIAVAVWMNIAPSSLPPKFRVPVYVDLNQPSFENTVYRSSLVEIEFLNAAQMGKTTNLLHELHLELVGPDPADGHFLLRKYDGSYLTHQDTTIIEKLKAYSSLLRIVEAKK